MTYFVGEALTCAGAMAEPTATELISTAAKALTSVRLKLDWPDMFLLPFFPRLTMLAVMPLSIQELCQSLKTAENRVAGAYRGRVWEKLPPDIGKICQPACALDREPLRDIKAWDHRGSRKGLTMLGKVAGAWLGRRIAGRNSGTKGMLIGAGVAALARRGLGPLAAAAALGYGAKKLWDRRKRRSRPSYPSEAAPSPPGG